jgi:hypothetical protein
VHKSRITKFFMAPPNTDGPSVWNFVINYLEPKMLRWRLVLCAVCASLSHTHTRARAHTHLHTHTHTKRLSQLLRRHNRSLATREDESLFYQQKASKMWYQCQLLFVKMMDFNCLKSERDSKMGDGVSIRGLGMPLSNLEVVQG